MPRYYCDYCDTYLTHDSVGSVTPRVLLRSIGRSTGEGGVVFILPVLRGAGMLVRAAVSAEAAQRWLQAQGRLPEGTGLS